MKLMILESGAKAKTVKKYLGKGWIVQACGGHVQDLPSKGSKGSSKSMWKSEKKMSFQNLLGVGLKGRRKKSKI